MLKYFAILELLWLCLSSVHGIGPLESWEISPSTLSTTRYYGFIAYNEDSSYSDCIFVFGGVGCTTCMECYNITDNTVSTFDTLTTGGYNEVQSNAVMVIDSDTGDELIYFITRDGYLQKYDLNTKTESTKYYNSAAVQSCLVKNENDNELYIVDGSSGSSFWIYDLLDGELITGPSLTYTRDDEVCTTSYWNENEPYLYVLGGNAGYIERIQIDGLLNDIESGTNSYDWELLLLQLTSNIDDRCNFAYQSTSRLISVVSYRNYIYLIGGYDGAAEADIVYLDVENWEIKYVGEYVAARYGIRCQYASLTERVYCFGGTTTADIAFTNIVPTVEPTPAPSVDPTLSPSDRPSYDPTAMPTIPTMTPSSPPTNNDSTTVNPTSNPSPRPTPKPTDRPTNTPSDRPTNTPTDKPTSVAPGTPTKIPTKTPSKTPTAAPNGNSGLSSSSSSSSSTSSLSTDDPLVIVMIVFFSVFGACCCCISCCVIGYIGYNKVWKPHNDRIKRENQMNLQQSQGLVQIHSAPVSPRGDVIRMNSDSAFGGAGTGMNVGANGIKQYFSTLGTGAYAFGGEAGDNNGRNNNNIGATPGGPQRELIYIDGRPVVIRDNFATNAQLQGPLVTGQVQYAQYAQNGNNGNNGAKNKKRNKKAKGGNNNNNDHDDDDHDDMYNNVGGGGGGGDGLEIEMKPIEMKGNGKVLAHKIEDSEDDDGSLLGGMNKENNETNSNQNNQGEQMENGL